MHGFALFSVTLRAAVVLLPSLLFFWYLLFFWTETQMVFTIPWSPWYAVCPGWHNRSLAFSWLQWSAQRCHVTELVCLRCRCICWGKRRGHFSFLELLGIKWSEPGFPGATTWGLILKPTQWRAESRERNLSQDASELQNQASPEVSFSSGLSNSVSQ